MRLIDLVLQFPNKPWNWFLLSQNPNITFADVLANSDNPWDWEYLSRNKFGWERLTEKDFRIGGKKYCQGKREFENIVNL